MSFVGMSIFCDLDTFFDPEKFPEGLHTHIEEQSSKLSGGERQRLVLARALIRSSHVLLLDEAFSALDLTTRRRIEVRDGPAQLPACACAWLGSGREGLRNWHEDPLPRHSLCFQCLLIHDETLPQVRSSLSLEAIV